MRRTGALVALVLLVAGCGQPQQVSKQAEEVQSVAAEGALLAHEVAEDGSLSTFRRAHSRALRERLGQLQPAIRDAQLARIAARVSRELERLGGDEPSGASSERRLERDADAAAELAK